MNLSRFPSRKPGMVYKGHSLIPEHQQEKACGAKCAEGNIDQPPFGLSPGGQPKGRRGHAWPLSDAAGQSAECPRRRAGGFALLHWLTSCGKLISSSSSNKHFGVLKSGEAASSKRCLPCIAALFSPLAQAHVLMLVHLIQTRNISFLLTFKRHHDDVCFLSCEFQFFDAGKG